MKEFLKCFVIMPLSDTENVAKKDWNYIYENWFKKAVSNYQKAKISCKRADVGTGNLINEIIIDLNDSDIVIAELTGQKANVYYELGIRHSIRRLGTIMLMQRPEKPVSDLGGAVLAPYNYSGKSSSNEEEFEEFQTLLHKKIDFIIDNSDNSDSPVYDCLELKNLIKYNNREVEKSDLLYRITFFKNIVLKCFNDIDNFVNQRSNSYINNDLLNSALLLLITKQYETLTNEQLHEIHENIINIHDEFNKSYHIWNVSYMGSCVTPEDRKKYLEGFASHVNLLIQMEGSIIDKLNKLEEMVIAL